MGVEEFNSIIAMLNSEDLPSISLACKILKDNSSYLEFLNANQRISLEEAVDTAQWRMMSSYNNDFNEKIYWQLRALKHSLW